MENAQGLEHQRGSGAEPFGAVCWGGGGSGEEVGAAGGAHKCEGGKHEEGIPEGSRQPEEQAAADEQALRKQLQGTAKCSVNMRDERDGAKASAKQSLVEVTRENADLKLRLAMLREELDTVKLEQRKFVDGVEMETHHQISRERSKV